MGGVTTFESAFETSAGAQVRRLDVVPAGRVRRSWTPEAKARIIAESMAAGANVAAIARRNDMLPQHLYAWRREARERMETGGDTAFGKRSARAPCAASPKMIVARDGYRTIM